jgi:hypothetical protein
VYSIAHRFELPDISDHEIHSMLPENTHLSQSKKMPMAQRPQFDIVYSRAKTSALNVIQSVLAFNQMGQGYKNTL